MNEAISLALLTALAPFALGFAAPRLLSLDAVGSRQLAAAGAALALLGAGLAAVWFALNGAATASLASLPVLSVQLDGLTVVMLLAVAAIGAVVARYSIRYLDGHPRQARFSQWLSWTLGGVLLMVVSGHLLLLSLGAVATMHGLHQMLLHNVQRRLARRVARERFAISMLGHVLLAGMCVFAYQAFGTLEIAPMLEAAAEGRTNAWSTGMVGLIVAWAITQTAQLPFHDWLPSTMEAPTPVSALMHAGVVNAGGFLLIRFSPLLVSEPVALGVLAFIGALTAAFGALVMLTQTEIKAKYAYSTVSQMGFMIMQCGLGAFGAATLHLVGHSFYKGHAFLTAASAVDTEVPVAGAARRAAPEEHGKRMLFAVAVGTVTVGMVALVLGIDLLQKPGGLVLVGVLSLAVAQMLRLGFEAERGDGTGPTLRRDLILGAIAISVTYFLGTSGMRALLGSAVPPVDAQPALPLLAVVLLVAIFAATLWIQDTVMHAGVRGQSSRRWATAYVHLRHGLYLGTAVSRVVDALAWPGESAAPHSIHHARATRKLGNEQSQGAASA